jgi:predicted ATPase
MRGKESVGHTPIESVVRHVRSRKVLLVLDNCEHLVQACAEFVAALVRSCPELRVLATSRQALRVPGEVAWRVPSLEVPEPGERVEVEELLEYASVRLLVDRISQLQPEFPLSTSNAIASTQICRRLDGIPLAIELAAARAVAMSVQEIAARLDDRFHLVTGGSRTAPQRQRTLRATIDWSHDLLTYVEQILFRRVAVFAGGWTLDAAEAACADERLPPSDILDVLMRLVEQSLVNVQVKDGLTRYRLLETVHVYAAERLQASGEASAAQARHCAWCLAFVERAAHLTNLSSPERARWYPLVVAEHDNIRAALDFSARDVALAEVELKIAAAMGQFWWPGMPGEGRRRLTEALLHATTTPSAARVTALTWRAMFERNFGDPAIGRDLARQAWSDARAMGDVRLAADAVRALAQNTSADEVAQRIALLEEGVELARAAGGNNGLALHLAYLGAAAAEAGDLERARALLEEGDTLAREPLHPPGAFVSRLPIDAQLGWLAVADGRLDDAELHFAADAGSVYGLRPWALLALGHVRLLQGDLAQARALHCRALVQVREFEPGGSTMADALLYMASVEEAAGLHERAQHLLGANEAWHAAHGGAGQMWRPWTWTLLQARLVQLPPAPTDPLLARARAEGRRMNLDQAVAFALQTVDAPPPRPEARGRSAAKDQSPHGSEELQTR